MTCNYMNRFSIQSIIRNRGCIMLIIFSVFLICILILAGVLVLISPGKPEPFLDANGHQLQGSISEKIRIKINGVEQGMFIKSKDAGNPVLLYLHGGMPDYFLTKKYPTKLEDYFTVVWWDQRGSGLSFSSDIPRETMTLEQMISDTKELTKYRGLRDAAMHSLGIGTTPDMKSVITGIFLPSLKSSEYTFMEKLNMWRGKSRAGISIVWSNMLTTDLSVVIPELKIPVYFIEGIYDYTCSYSEAKSFFEKLKAPVKGFYTFQNSAHSPFFEEPEKMQRIIKEDILTGSNNLDDTKLTVSGLNSQMIE